MLHNETPPTETPPVETPLPEIPPTETPLAVETPVPETPPTEMAPADPVAELTRRNQQLEHDVSTMRSTLAGILEAANKPDEAPPEPGPYTAPFSEDEYIQGLSSYDGFTKLVQKLEERRDARTIERLSRVLPDVVRAEISQRRQVEEVQTKTAEFWEAHPELKGHERRIGEICIEVMQIGKCKTLDDLYKATAEEAQRKLGLYPATASAPSSPSMRMPGTRVPAPRLSRVEQERLSMRGA